ncbi:MAG: flagellar basal body L-ring protein FlgH [Alphaproteobacteria bacterium]|nr:flagellar basal body L-ring protein FlgH [Alphaproteobacteria bacterium]
MAAMLSLTACAGMEERLSRIGVEPPLSNIDNPTQKKGYKPLSFPMPEQQMTQSSPNSLWQPHRQTFFKDQRAGKVGDILTVLIDIDDEADMKNKTERTRQNAEAQGLPNLLGWESIPGHVLPKGYDPSNLVNMNSDSSSTGDGTLKRTETIKLKLAAMIMQVLPNGNFVIKGQQEVRVNYELRQLTLAGVIRPEDILNNNSISYEKVAEARISYGGKGTMSDIQTPRYGDQLIDALFPF